MTSEEPEVTAGATAERAGDAQRGGDTWRVGAYAICRRGGEALLVRASHRTAVEGRWFLPGGGLRFGEAPEDAVIRELQEETGLAGSGPRLLRVISDVHDRVAGGRLCMLRLIYAVDVPDGTLVHETDGTSDEARWVPLDEVVALGATDYAVRALGLDDTPADPAT